MLSGGLGIWVCPIFSVSSPTQVRLTFSLIGNRDSVSEVYSLPLQQRYRTFLVIILQTRHYNSVWISYFDTGVFFEVFGQVRTRIGRDPSMSWTVSAT